METFIYTKRFHTPVHRTVMPSGAEVWTCPLASRMVSIETVFPFGAMEDGEHKGIAHFLEHLMMKGPDADGIHPLLRPLIRKGCVSNAETGLWNMRFKQFGLVENLADMLTAMSGILKSISFTAKQTDMERQVILTEIAQREGGSNWSAWLFPKIYPELFSEFVPIGGTPESVRAITYSDLVRHARQKLDLSRALYLAAGKLTHEEHLEWIKSLYPECMQTGAGSRSLCATKFVPPNGIYVGAKKLKTEIRFYHQYPQDREERVRLGLALHALASYPSGLLMEKLRNQLRLVYSIGVERDNWPLLGGHIAIPLKPKDFDAVQQAVQEVMHAVLKNGLSKDVLELTKLMFRINCVKREESFTRETALSHMHGMWFSNDVTDVDDESLILEATPAQVHEACIKYLDPDKMGIVKRVRPDTELALARRARGVLFS